jgi:kynurenine formamidase
MSVLTDLVTAISSGAVEVIDLTAPLSAQTPILKLPEPLGQTWRFGLQEISRYNEAGPAWYWNNITTGEHTGTHLDAPMHFIANGGSADRIPVDRFFAPLAVVSIEARAAKDPDAMVTVDDLLAWEKRHGRLPRGAFVAMHSGWDARIGSAERFLNRDAKGTMHAPGFSEEAARFLAQQRDIVGAGVDTLSLDAASAQKFVAHLALLGAGKYGVELLANLAMVPPSGATIIVGGPKHEGASGGPVRVFAVA